MKQVDSKRKGMSGLTDEIRKLKAEGKSLRAIAATLSISHEAVSKRLKTIESDEQASNGGEKRWLRLVAGPKEIVGTRSKAHKSRAFGQTRHTVKRVSTKETPSHTHPYRRCQPFWKPLQGPSIGHERDISGGRFKVRLPCEE